VSNLDRSLEYYRTVLGLQVLSRAGAAVVLGPAGSDAPLVELLERPGATPATRRGRLGLYHFAILLPTRADLGRFVAHLRDIGAHAGSADHLVSEALYLTDPDGLGIEVYADRPRTEWRRNGTDLAMDSLPLDFDALREAAGGTTWAGMPAGTVMGHLHLSVGDLRAAEAFFGAALGFDVTVRGYPGALFLSAGGYHHHLGTNIWAGVHAPEPMDADTRLLEWQVVVPDASDAEAAAASMERTGRSVRRTDNGWLVTDPWGTTLRLRPESPSR
jgi:catechol 2,3-dioxygenase